MLEDNHYKFHIKKINLKLADGKYLIRQFVFHHKGKYYLELARVSFGYSSTNKSIV